MMDFDSRIADLETRLDSLEVEMARVSRVEARIESITESLNLVIRIFRPMTARYVTWLVNNHRPVPEDLNTPIMTIPED